MSRLAELLHDKTDELQVYLERVQTILDDLRFDPRIRCIYVVKGRIKSYQSIRRKLLTEHRKAGLHNDPGLTIERLMEVVPDVVGLRLVCLFSDDVDRVLHTLLNRDGHTRTLEVLKKKGTKQRLLTRYVFDTPMESTTDDESWKQAKRKKTGYTSVHAIGALGSNSRFYHQFGRYRFEIQIRTVLEEAWAETSHFLAYKKATTDRTISELRLLMGQITGMNEKLLQICEDATKLRRASEFRYVIQVSADYMFDPSEDVSGHFIERLKHSQELRIERKHKDALDVHVELVGAAELERNVPEPYRRSVKNTLLCEQALDHLYLSADTRALSAAKKLYEEVVRDDELNFWANFRMAYVLTKEGRLEKSVEWCVKSLELFDSQLRMNPSPLRWWDTTGLRADILAFTGRCCWAIWERQCRVAWGRDGQVNQHLLDKERKWLDRTLEYTNEALQECTTLGDRCPIDQSIRCHNNLAFCHTQKADYASAAQHIGVLENRAMSPFVLDTLAWYEFKRPGGNREQALERSERALDLLVPDKSTVQASREIIRQIQDHHYLIRRHVRDNIPYEDGDEYWVLEQDF